MGSLKVLAHRKETTIGRHSNATNSAASRSNLVFTGGIGENDAQVRAEICAGLAWIGVSLDESRNCTASNPVSDRASRCQVLALESQENEQIARHAWALLA